MKEIILGAGCFWCVEAMFQQLKGVEKVESGYAGGRPFKSNLQGDLQGRYGTCRSYYCFLSS